MGIVLAAFIPAILLTGMGADGARGLLRMRQAGAVTVAQNRESCVVYGMPKEAVKLDAAEKIVSGFSCRSTAKPRSSTGLSMS